jgi:hypothetical protein
MKCAKCGNLIKIFGLKKITSCGILCTQCYESNILSAQEEMCCITCGKPIKSGDSFATTQSGDAKCYECFNTIIDTASLSSKFILIFGLLIITFGMVLGVMSIFYTQNLFFIGVSGVIIGAMFIGLSKIVEAAEMYVIKNR